jgi:dATP pyrophosphohydrolase
VKYKQPRSVQVVIFSDQKLDREYLLLRRVASLGGFWQSVTGSLEEGESHQQTACREVREETGIEIEPKDLIDLRVTNRFEISPLWKSKYAPGITHNEEVCFAVSTARRSVTVDPTEHDSYRWADYRESIELLYWESNKRAFDVARRIPRHSRVESGPGVQEEVEPAGAEQEIGAPGGENRG